MDDASENVLYFHHVHIKISDYLGNTEYEDSGEVDSLLLSDSDGNFDRNSSRIKMFSEVRIFRKNQSQERYFSLSHYIHALLSLLQEAY